MGNVQSFTTGNMIESNLRWANFYPF